MKPDLESNVQNNEHGGSYELWAGDGQRGKQWDED